MFFKDYRKQASRCQCCAKFHHKKLICVEWGTGKYLKVCLSICPRVAGTSQIYQTVLPVRFSQTPNTIQINFLAVKFINKLKSTSLFLTEDSFLQHLILCQPWGRGEGRSTPLRISLAVATDFLTFIVCFT